MRLQTLVFFAGFAAAGGTGVLAQGMPESECNAIWVEARKVVTASAELGTVQDGWCVLSNVVIDLAGTYVPQIHVDELRFRGSAVPWFLGTAWPDGTGKFPGDLQLRVKGLQHVIQLGDAPADYLFAAQARTRAIDGSASLYWVPETKTLTVSALDLDFPGKNALSLKGRITGVDPVAMRASGQVPTDYALTDAELDVTTHGLFEEYLLPALVSAALPQGAADVERVRGEALQFLADLPDASVPSGTKDALSRLIDELPNPSGTLVAQFRSEPGFGPARLVPFAAGALPKSAAEAAPLFEGVHLDATWTHETGD